MKLCISFSGSTVFCLLFLGGGRGNVFWDFHEMFSTWSVSGFLCFYVGKSGDHKVRHLFNHLFIFWTFLFLENKILPLQRVQIVLIGISKPLFLIYFCFLLGFMQISRLSSTPSPRPWRKDVVCWTGAVTLTLRNKMPSPRRGRKACLKGH